MRRWSGLALGVGAMAGMGALAVSLYATGDAADGGRPTGGVATGSSLAPGSAAPSSGRPLLAAGPSWTSSPSSSATGLPSGSALPVAAPLRCSIRDFEVRRAAGNSDDFRWRTLYQLTNVAGSSCTTRGYPLVTGAAPRGVPTSPTNWTVENGERVTPTALRIAPGESVDFYLIASRWSDNTIGRCPNASLHVALPRDGFVRGAGVTEGPAFCEGTAVWVSPLFVPADRPRWLTAWFPLPPATPSAEAIVSLLTRVSAPPPAPARGGRPCSSADLQLRRLVADAGMMHVQSIYGLRNVSRSRCTLRGVPGIRARTTAGKSPILEITAWSPKYATSTVTVAPGRSAFFASFYVNPSPLGFVCRPKEGSMKFVLPGGRGVLDTGETMAPCDHSAYTITAVFSLDPVPQWVAGGFLSLDPGN